MKLVKAAVKDIDSVMRLIKNCIEDMAKNGIYQWGEDYPTVPIFEKDVEDGELYLIWEQDKLAAVFVMNEEQSEEYEALKWSTAGEKILVLHRLAVDPSFQNRGVAAKIVKYAVNYGIENKYEAIRLDAYSLNKVAVKLYEKQGFNKVGEIFFPHRKEAFYCYEKLLTI